MPNYGNVVTSSQPNKKSGYKNVLYFNEVADISVWQRPTAAGAVIGDTLNIATAHTWASGKSALAWETKIGSVQATMETGGDAGARETMHVVRVEVLGDGAALLEQVNRMLNDNKVIWLKESDCLVADSYVQFGDDCNPVSVTSTFDSKTNNPEQMNGQKSYVLEFRSKVKFFYGAALDFTP